MVPDNSPEDSSQGLGASHGEPTDKRPGGFQILSPWGPAFLLQKNIMRMPKMNSLMSKQDVESINYYERLRQCIVFELADEDRDWFKLIINDYVVNGHLKQILCCQASILELAHSQQSNFMAVYFLKSIKLQMLYANYFRTTDCIGVQSLDYMIHVEVEQ
jgi:hypothetical protein